MKDKRLFNSRLIHWLLFLCLSIVFLLFMASSLALGMPRHTEKFASSHLQIKRERYYENSQSFMLNCIAVCKKSGTFACRFTNWK